MAVGTVNVWDEAPEHLAHLPALADPRAHPRRPARGRVGDTGVGGPDDFPRLVELIASLDLAESSSCAVRTLFAIRWKMGELLGWDRPDAGLGSRSRRSATGCRRICGTPPTCSRDGGGADFSLWGC